MQFHLHVHLHGKRSSDHGWQRLAVLVAIGTLILAALPWLGLTPSQPQPMRVQVTLVQPGAAPAPSTQHINSRRPIWHADRLAATIAVDGRPRPKAAGARRCRARPSRDLCLNKGLLLLLTSHQSTPRPPGGISLIGCQRCFPNCWRAMCMRSTSAHPGISAGSTYSRSAGSICTSGAPA